MKKRLFKRKISRRKIIILSSLIILISIPLTVILVQKNQELRRGATGGPCKICVGLECDSIANFPFCEPASNECKQSIDCKKMPVYKIIETTPAEQTPEPTPFGSPSSNKNIFQMIIDTIISTFTFR